MEFDAKILTGRLIGKYTTDKGKAGPGRRTIDGSFASYREGSRMSKFRGCGARARRLKGISMRSAETLTVERLESRCVLSAGPYLPTPPAHSTVETSGPSPVAPAPAPDMGNHHLVLDNGYAPVPHNSGQSAAWGQEPVVIYIQIIYAVPHTPDTSGDGDSYWAPPTHQDFRPPKSVPIAALEGLSTSTSQVGSDQANSGTVQNVASEHAKPSEATVRDQSGQSETAASRMASASTNQSSYTVAPWMSHTASLMPGRAASQLFELILGKQFLASGGAKVADGSQTGGDAAIQLVRAGVASLAGAEMLADVVHGGLPLLAEMHLNLPNVQQALDTVMADIKLIGTEVSEWLGGVRFTPAVLAVTAATAGAGAAAYLRRRKGRETGDHDDEASSSWLFARLQPIPLE